MTGLPRGGKDVKLVAGVQTALAQAGAELQDEGEVVLIRQIAEGRQLKESPLLFGLDDLASDSLWNMGDLLVRLDQLAAADAGRRAVVLGGPLDELVDSADFGSGSLEQTVDCLWMAAGNGLPGDRLATWDLEAEWGFLYEVKGHGAGQEVGRHREGERRSVDDGELSRMRRSREGELRKSESERGIVGAEVLGLGRWS